MDKKHRGAASELTATVWLLDQGYDVFRNVSQHGLADLVAINFQTGERLLVDVKTAVAHTTPDGEVSLRCTKLSKEQREAGVRLLVVSGDQCVWMNPQVD